MSAARIIAKLPTAHDRQPLIAGVLEGTLTKQDVTVLVDQTLAQPAHRAQDAARSESQEPPAAVAPDAVRLGDRQLARDMTLLRTIIARWTTAASLTAPQRRALQTFMDDELAPDLATLRQALRSPGNGRKNESVTHYVCLSGKTGVAKRGVHYVCLSGKTPYTDESTGAKDPS